MINKIKSLDSEKAKHLLDDFMEVYMDKGFGVMNKTEIETLMYHVLKKHGLLTGKCFEDSFKLQIPEAKARKLIYESQVKYAGRNEDELTAYLRISVGECLTHAFLSKKGSDDGKEYDSINRNDFRTNYWNSYRSPGIRIFPIQQKEEKNNIKY